MQSVSPTGAPSWSPDGRRLATEGIPFADDPVESKSSQIYVVPTRGGAPLRLTKPVEGVFTHLPTWQPEGDQIAFYIAHGSFDSAPSLATIRSSGGALRVLVSNRKGLGFSWSPTGKSLVYEYDDGGMYVVKPSGLGRRRIVVAVRKHSTHTWSPDGSRVAFVYPSGGIGISRLTGGARRLTSSGTDPRWSPDGSSIAFVDGQRVKVASSSGGVIRTVADVHNTVYGLSWSPDGRRLSLRAAPTGFLAATLRVIDLRERRLRTLARGVVTWSWRTDGRTIAYSVNRSLPRSELWIVRPDGRARRSLGRGSVPTWSPQGEKLAFLVPKVPSGAARLCMIASEDAGRVCLL